MSKPAIYLSGSIEYSKNFKFWRNLMYKKLHTHYKVIIPDKADCPFDKEDAEYKGWMRENIIMKDMVDVATSKYFFVKLDKAVFKGAGTISEVSTAAWLGKDIVVFLDGITEEKIPSWMLGCLSGAVFVNSIDEAIKLYLERAKVVK
jgi:hypothetical protein